MAPFGANALSLLAATLTVIVSLAVSNEPQSALPREVYVIVPSEFLTAVPKVNVPEGFVSVLARTKNWSPRSERAKL